MKYWTVEHMQGTAGVNESAVETHEDVEAATAIEAIRRVAVDVEGWREDGAVLENPEAANQSGSYCDYWVATETYASVIRTAVTQSDIDKAVDALLNERGIVDHEGETYAETAERIRESDHDTADLLDLAERRWFEVDA